MKREVVFILTSIVIVAIIVIFMTFFYHPGCGDIACWNAKLSGCERASYVNNNIDVTWRYTVLKEKGEECIVKVEVLDIKRGLKKTEILENKYMICNLPLGSTTNPEGNPNFCTGLLKEAMQTLIIEKLHEYIVQNTGQISEELTKIEEIGE